MADWGSVVTQYPGVVFLGGTQTQAVTFVGYVTKPSGVYFEVPIPQSVYSATQVNDYGIGYSGTIEAVIALPSVVGAQWTQAPTASGELTSNLEVFVASTSGNSQASLTVPFSGLAPSLVEPKTNTLAAELTKAEEL